MNREELKKYIGVTGYSLGQVEKDYFQHMVLGAQSRKLGGVLVFKGGTALQKLGLISRFSEGLDFTTRRYDLKMQKIQESVVGIINNYNYLADVDNQIDDEMTIGFRIKIQGPLYRNRNSICTIRIEISKKEIVILKPMKKEFTPPYTDILPYIMNVMQMDEILAEKIRAIYTRQKARDLYDIYKILESGTNFDIDLTNKKLEYYDLQFDAPIFYKNCEKLKPNWENELQSLMENQPSSQKALNTVKEKLKNK